MKLIREVPVYDGRYKQWRVLNLSTGTIYSMFYETEDDARHSIEHGEKRGDALVLAVS